jgi:hypothetical protein
MGYSGFLFSNLCILILGDVYMCVHLCICIYTIYIYIYIYIYRRLMHFFRAEVNASSLKVLLHFFFFFSAFFFFTTFRTNPFFLRNMAGPRCLLTNRPAFFTQKLQSFLCNIFATFCKVITILNFLMSLQCVNMMYRGWG